MKFKLKIKYFFAPLCFAFLVSCSQSEVITPTGQASISENENSFNLTKDVSTNIGLDLNDKTPLALDFSIPFTAIQGTWVQTDVLDHQGTSTTCDMLYAHLDDTLKFSTETLRPIGWIETAGFNLVNNTPNVPHDCYHGMYQVDGANRLVDIMNLYCSTPVPPEGRCGPPSAVRFNITHISEKQLILESYTAGYDIENIDLMVIPAEHVQSYVFERL